MESELTSAPETIDSYAELLTEHDEMYGHKNNTDDKSDDITTEGSDQNESFGEPMDISQYGETETENTSKLDNRMKKPDVDRDMKLDAFIDNDDKNIKNTKVDAGFLPNTDDHQTLTLDVGESLDSSSLDDLAEPRDKIEEIKTGQTRFKLDEHKFHPECNDPGRDMEDGIPRKSAIVTEVPNYNDFNNEINADHLDAGDIETNGDNGVIDFDEKLFDSKVESIDCDMCFVAGKVVSPTTYCYVCQIYMCGSCYRHHSKIPATRDHSVIHRNDLIKNTYKQTTTYHGEKLTDVTPPTPNIPMNRKLVDPGRYASEHVRDEDTLCAPCRLEGRNESGSAFCVTCTQYLCIKCKTHHTKFGASMDHEVVHKHSMADKDFKTFVPSYTTGIQNSLKGISNSFGSTSTLKSEASRRGQTTPMHGQTITFKNPKTFSALVYHDGLTPQITGLAFIGGSKLLVCDRRNKSLKLFSDKLTPLSALNTPDVADVTALNDTTAVVTQPDKSVMLYIGIKENSKLFVRRSIQTKGSYWGVDSLHGELFALCMADSSSQATIHMLSRSGEILSIVHPHLGQGYDLQLKNSNYFAVSPAGGTFYMSDSILGVVAIGTDGRAIFSCQSPDIERPCGIQADSKNVYVCCPATGSMVTISPDGRHFSEVLSFGEEMVLPNCVALAPNSSQMAVAFLEGETINVYKNKNQI